MHGRLRRGPRRARATWPDRWGMGIRAEPRTRNDCEGCLVFGEKKREEMLTQKKGKNVLKMWSDTLRLGTFRVNLPLSNPCKKTTTSSHVHGT